MTASTGLTIDSPAPDIHKNVQFLIVGGNPQRLFEKIPEGFQGKIFFKTAAVHFDSRRTFPDVNPGYRRFTTACAVG
jgi:hypothetical protein